MRVVPSALCTLVAVCLLQLAASTAAEAQEMRTVSGTVTDSGGHHISYVTLDGGAKYRTVTNAVGEFRLLVPQNVGVQVLVRRIGFLPTKFKIEPGGDTTITVPMQQLAVLMNTQIVRAQQLVRSLELRGFYERMLESQKGALVGEYVMPEEIEMRNPQRVSQVLETRRGITVRRVGSCNIIATCYRVFGTGGCPATVFLDGQRLNSLAAASNDLGATPAVDELIPVTHVSGVEIYPRGAAAPPKYQALGGSCAIVLIWTK
jgi:carboxypeptidase family protein